VAYTSGLLNRRSTKSGAESSNLSPSASLNTTKVKGDIGLTQVIADLTKKGKICAIPIADHLPFDLIVCTPDTFVLSKVQVKYRKLGSDGKIHLPLSTVSSSRVHGNKTTPYDLTQFDYFAIYNPDTDKCYYVPTKEILNGEQTSWFILAVKNEHKLNRLASDYTEMR
jgi:hypothetical protein